MGICLSPYPDKKGATMNAALRAAGRLPRVSFFCVQNLEFVEELVGGPYGIGVHSYGGPV